MKEVIKKGISLVVLVAILYNFTGCASKEEQITESLGESSTTASVDEEDYSHLYSEEDILEDYLIDEVVKISLDDQEASSNYMQWNDGNLHIIKGGTYYIEGTLEQGQVIIDVNEEENVRLIFDNIKMMNDDDAVINCISAKKLIITLVENSNNYLSNGSYDGEAADKEKGVLVSKTDLTINGLGNLEIDAQTGHGINAKDLLVLANGSLNINAKEHGIRAKDGVVIIDGNYQITSEEDGVQTDNAEEDNGNIYIINGDFNISSQFDAIQSERNLYIFNGNFNIETNGGYENAPEHTDDFGQGFGGMGGGNRPQRQENSEMPDFESGEIPNFENGEVPEMPNPNDGETLEMPNSENEEAVDATITEEETESYKGLKAKGNIEILNGEMVFNSADDSIHANGTVVIRNGIFTIQTGDDAIHADVDVTIEDGIIDILNCYEGIEGPSVQINNGTININASDDGINASADNQEAVLEINGGLIYIDTEKGDGIDINGTGIINGGNITVLAATSGPDSAIDYDKSLVINGGELIGLGLSQMAMAPQEGSTQPVIAIQLSDYISGQQIVVKKDQNEIMNVEASKQCNHIVISSEQLNLGDEIEVSIGEQVIKITLEEIVTSIDDQGNAVQMNSFPGGGGMGGRNRR